MMFINLDTIIPNSSDPILERFSSPPMTNRPTQEQILRSQYDNEQCDLMSLIKVHEYLTKQHPSSTLAHVEQINPSSSSSTPPIHHQSYSTLTSVTYRSSLAKQIHTSGPPISTPSHTSHSSSEINMNTQQIDGQDRRGSIISDIHHLTRSPNTFETSMISHSSSNSQHQNQDTLSYLIEQNERAMKRLIADYRPTLPTESTAFLSSASMRLPDCESGPLTVTGASSGSNEVHQQRSTYIETGSLSTMDFPSILLQAEEQARLKEAAIPSQVSVIRIQVLKI